MQATGCDCIRSRPRNIKPLPDSHPTLYLCISTITQILHHLQLLISIIQGAMYGRMSENRMAQKIYKDVNLERKGNRNRRFQQSRKNRQQQGQEMAEEKELEDLDYLKNYEDTLRRDILYSLTAQIPHPLPPLGITTISFYRRSDQPVFQTRIKGEIDSHMTYESLTILAKVDERMYANYNGLVKEFQRDLSVYQAMPSKDIREMAAIAAGNKILGRGKDILALVKHTPKEDLWVLVNHVYENKINCKHLFPYLRDGHVLAFKALYQLSNNKGDECITAMVDSDETLEVLLAALKSLNLQIQRHAIRIIGNIIGDSLEHLQIFQKYKLIDYFLKLLLSGDKALLKDACWMISNYSCSHSSATAVLFNAPVSTRLMDLLHTNAGLEIIKQIFHIFNFIAHFAKKEEAFEYLVSRELLNFCQGYLSREDTELSIVTLGFVQALLQLGGNFPNEDGLNVVGFLIKQNSDLFNDIMLHSEAENFQISAVAIEIVNYLNGQQEQL